nr:MULTISPECIES: 2Fe-2S iron-sulfur cluster-binding protein [unclassified Rhodanobacter]
MKTTSSGAHAYVCGPSGFIAKAEACAASAGLPGPHFHRECFSNDLLSIATLGSSFSVTLARSGEVLLVGPDESLLSALKRHGIKVDSSCEQGLCGSCVIGVLSGDLDHRDLVLSDAEKSRGNRIIACVSRCRGKLTLDL